MTTDRLAELRDKVRHGYNLLAAEAREVFEHFGEPIGPERKRCGQCEGTGKVVAWTPLGDMRDCCPRCNGTGYEVEK